MYKILALISLDELIEKVSIIEEKLIYKSLNK